MSESKRPSRHVCPTPPRPVDHGCRYADGTLAPLVPHLCWHCHDDPPKGHICPCCEAAPRGSSSAGEQP